MLIMVATPYGRYRWMRLPFGVSSVMEIFQRKLMEQLEGLRGIAMIDKDIVMFGQGKTHDEAVKCDYERLHLLHKRA